MDFKLEIAKKIAQVTNLELEEILSIIEIPPDKNMGDYAFPCFKLAKVLRKAPQMIAQDLADQIKADNIVDRAENLGGYLNIFVNKDNFVQNIIEKALSQGENYGSSSEGEGKRVVIDYSSPNIAKPFHIGHLRSTVIGNSLYKIYKFLGYRSVGINHLGDWGTQFGKEIVAYRRWGNREEVEREPIQTLLDLYVKFHDEAEKDPTLEDEARLWFKKLEDGDKEATELWQWFRDVSLMEFERVYKKLDITFDSYAGESFYNDKMDKTIELLKEKGLLKESQGANIVDLEEFNLPPCIIQKRDGSTIYATRDITALLYRKEHYDFHKAIYVVGGEQQLHFQQIFKVAELLGNDWYKDCVHIYFGLIKLETGKMSTRKGKAIFLDDVLEEAVKVTLDIITEKNPNLENKEEVAKQVGIGAIIFNDLSNNRIKDVIFSWDRVLNFDGETGPYVQYTHARAASVLRKATVSLEGPVDYSILNHQEAVDTIKLIGQFPEIVKSAAYKYEPSMIARHIIDVAQAFNRFYHDYSIITEDETTQRTRLHLVKAVVQVIKTGLGLLGIHAPEKM